MNITLDPFTKCFILFCLARVKMAFVNFSNENGEDFISIQHNTNVIKLDVNHFSHLMLNLRDLKTEIIKKVNKIVLVKLKLVEARELNLRKE